MSDSSPPSKQLLFHVQKVLKALQGTIIDPELDTEDIIVTILKQIAFFNKIIEAPVRLEDFYQRAKSHFHYEVYPYGTALVKEKEYADKFSIILKGNLQQLHQRPYGEVEKEYKENRQKPDISPPRKEEEPSPAIGKPSRRLKKGMTMKLTHALSPMPVSITKLDSKSTFNDLFSPTAKSPTHIESPVLYKRPDLKRLGSAGASPLDSPSGIGNSLLLDKGMSVPETKTLSPIFTFIRPTREIKESLTDIPPLGPSTTSHIPTKPDESEDFGQSRIFGITQLRKFSSEEQTMGPTNQKPQDHLSFVKQIVSRNPDMRDRCFLGNTIRVNKTKVLTPGQFIGENFHKTHQARENSIIAVSSPEVHLLTLTRADFKAVLIECYKRANEKAQIFSELFPSMNDEEINKFSHYFVQKTFKKGEVIYSQDEYTRELYLLQEGDVKLVKIFDSSPAPMGSSPVFNFLTTAKSSRRTELPIAGITKGQFFGEEILQDKDRRQYTAIVSTQDCIVYVLDISMYEKMQEQLPHLFKELKNRAQERFAWREQRASVLTAQQISMLRRGSPEPSPDRNSSTRQFSFLRVSPVHQREGLNTSFNSSMSDQEQAPEDLDEMNRVRSLDRAFVAKIEAQQKQFQTYKNKFARRLQLVATPNEERRSSQTRKGERMATLVEEFRKPPQTAFEELNVMRELKEEKQSRYRLVKHSSTPDNSHLNISPKKETRSRGSSRQKMWNKEPLMTFFSPAKKSVEQVSPKAKDYSSLLGNLGGLSPNGVIGKARVNNLLRMTFNSGMFSRQPSAEKPKAGHVRGRAHSTLAQ